MPIFCNRRQQSVPVRIAGVILVLFAWPTLGQASTPALSMGEAVDIALDRAPMLDARSASVEAARQDRVRAGALPDPMLTVGIDNLPVTGPEAFDPAADFMTMKRIGIRQEVPARAERQARRSLADRAIAEARALTQVERLNVQREASAAWIGLWTAQRSVERLETLREQSVLASRLARARVSGGTDSVAGALATEAAVLELDNRLEVARAEVAAAQVALTRWIGTSDVRAKPALPDLTVLPVPEAELLASLDRLGPLLAIDARTDTTAAAIDLAQAEKRPDWSIAASYGQRDGGRSDMVMVEFGIQLPLSAAGRQDRDVAARRAEYEGALAALEDARREQAARIRAAVARWQALLRQVARDQDALLPLQRDRSATALASFRAGAPVAAWLEARQDEIDAELEHIRRTGELGRLWASLAYLLPAEEAR